jgi:small subunit ribosomal protein S1
MEEIEREAAEAMAAMDPDDLAEITGGVGIVESDSIEPGTELTGTVVGVSGDEVFLEFGVKAQGVVPRSQFGKKEMLCSSRRVDVVVERYDRDSGLLVVSRKGALQRATWQNLSLGMVVEGRITGLNKGGLEVDLKGIRAFMPASQVDVVPGMKDISTLLGKTVRCEVIELDRRGKNVLLSRRKVIETELAKKREELKADLAVGQVRKGVVGNITEFGAFVDLGGIEGLVHIRDLSWGTVEKVSDVLSPGQEIEVSVLKIDLKRDRISLGLKQTQPDPWADVPERYPVGTQLKARILRVASFGAFAELEKGVEGLIPLSEMDWVRVNRPANLVSANDIVDVAVIRVEPEKRRLALSMKQAKPDPWEEVLESFSERDVVKGRVTRVVDFGAFVELSPGVEGLVHISELAEGRVKTCREVVTDGQEVEVRVLGIDKGNRRISLSIKAVTTPAETVPEEAPKKPKKRKKPLRGGLASHFEW